MDRGPFTPSLRVMSTLPRWGIVRVLHRQSVAEHSFYVALYADGIADLLGWTNESRRVHLLRSALWHDVDEIVTGDIPGPVKRAIPQRDTFETYVITEMRKHFVSYPRAREEEKPVLVAANLLDECAYLLGETRGGNMHVVHALSLSKRRLRAIWRQLDLPIVYIDEFLEAHATMDTPLPGDEE